MPYQLSPDVPFPNDLVTKACIVARHAAPNPVTGIQDPEPLPNSFLPPVARIPPEVLSYVFRLYVYDKDEFTPVTVSPQGPSFLRQVSKLWRAVAESDSHLWTSIHFYFPETCESCEEDVQRIQPLFDLHLERSGTLPLSLTFIDHRIYSISTNKLVYLLVDRLRTHSCRWSQISLHLSCSYFPVLFSFTPCDLSSLKRLHLTSDLPGPEPFAVPLLDLESATNLKSLAYSGFSASLDDTIAGHWERLAEVSFDFVQCNPMDSPFIQEFTHLSQCRNITTCSLGFHITTRNIDQFITLPHLRTLRVRRLSSESDASFLDALILPQLQTLEIDAAFLMGLHSLSWPWHQRNFSNLLARSGCTLRHLSIRDVDFPSDEVVRCLAISHALTSFRFIPYPRSQDITDVIHALDVSGAASVMEDQTPIQTLVVGNSPLLAKLREVTLATSQEGCLDSMMAMLRSRGGTSARAEKVAALRRVEVEYFNMPHRPEDQLRKVVAFRRQLAQWVTESEGESGSGNGERLEASVVIASPYLAEYISAPSENWL